MSLINDILKFIYAFYLKIIVPLNKNNLLFYVIYFFIFFFIYFIHSSKTSINIFSNYIEKYKNNHKFLKMFYGINISLMILLFGYIIYTLIYTKKDSLKIKSSILGIYIFVMFFISYMFVGLMKNYLSKLPSVFYKIMNYIYYLSNTIFYVLFFCLFIHNLNQDINIEVLIAIELVILFSILNLSNIIVNVKNINESLKKNDYLFLTLNCFKGSNSENFNTNNNYNPQINQINKEYGSTYLRLIGNIPVAFYNKNKKMYQNITLSDFYYPASAYSYLGDSPLNGTPNINALELALSKFKVRLITLDIYSSGRDNYSPRSEPIVRCKNMKDGAKALSLDECFDMINKWAWIVNNNNSYCYPFILILNFHFEYNENIYLKIYNSIVAKFSKYLMNKKYSFAGRNGIANISHAPMIECLGKIIIVTNSYPSKTILDEITNSTTNELTNDFKILDYKKDYITYEKIGISQDYNKNNLVEESKFNMRFFQSEPNTKYKNDAQPKAGLFNPNFQEVAQYGVQGTLMYLFIPDENLNKWYMYFKNKSNYDPVLKDESLRSIQGEEFEPKTQNPVTGIQKPQKYCVAPNGLVSSSKSNLSGGNTNNSCDGEDEIDTNYKVNTGINI
tara:strand:+ start:43 stop:1896 length:1854 start_codon:yes stop_codon:yes gene_type:complete